MADLLISSWTILNQVKTNLAGSHQLTRNLLKTDGDYTGIGNVWNTAINTFTGTLDGKGFYIEGLTGSNGLIKTANNATIRNLGLKDVVISGTNGLAALVMGSSTFANSMTGGSITSCWITGSVTGTGDWVAGFTTRGNCAMSKCYFNGTINNNAGSIAPMMILTNAGASFTDCYATGTMNFGPSSTYACSGFIVEAAGSSSITDCYSSVNIARAGAGTCSVGGFFANLSGGAPKNCYYAGQFSGPTSTYNGGFISSYGSGTITNCGWWTGAGPTYAIRSTGGSLTYNEANKAAFYDKTHNIYDTVTPYWAFGTTWYDHPAAFPDFVAPVTNYITSPVPPSFMGIY